MIQKVLHQTNSSSPLGTVSGNDHEATGEYDQEACPAHISTVGLQRNFQVLDIDDHHSHIFDHSADAQDLIGCRRSLDAPHHGGLDHAQQRDYLLLSFPCPLRRVDCQSICLLAYSMTISVLLEVRPYRHSNASILCFYSWSSPVRDHVL
jgi:hypothetical protein